MVKLLIVGEAPGPSGARVPGPALEGAAARLLADLAGIMVSELLDRTDRMNLLSYYPGPERGGGSAFPMAAGRASYFANLHRLVGRDVVFLGRAADVALPVSVPYFTWTIRHHGATSFNAARFPHPSGLNRQWNQREIREKAGAFLRLALAGTEVER